MPFHRGIECSPLSVFDSDDEQQDAMPEQIVTRESDDDDDKMPIIITLLTRSCSLADLTENVNEEQRRADEGDELESDDDQLGETHSEGETEIESNGNESVGVDAKPLDGIKENDEEAVLHLRHHFRQWEPDTIGDRQVWRSEGGVRGYVYKIAYTTDYRKEWGDPYSVYCRYRAFFVSHCPCIAAMAKKKPPTEQPRQVKTEPAASPGPYSPTSAPSA